MSLYSAIYVESLSTLTASNFLKMTERNSKSTGSVRTVSIEKSATQLTVKRCLFTVIVVKKLIILFVSIQDCQLFQVVNGSAMIVSNVTNVELLVSLRIESTTLHPKILTTPFRKTLLYA